MSEWKKSRIDEIGEVITGSTPSTKNSDYWNGTVPFYSPADFNDQVYCIHTEKNVTERALLISRPIPKNAVMFTCIASIGKMAISQNSGITNQQINTIIPKSDFFDYKFVYYLLFFYRNKFVQLAPQTTIPIINKTDFSNFYFNIPTFISEQHKISHILTTVDAVIEKTENAIAKYKAIKSGMMHDFFTRGIDLKTGKLRPRYEDAPELYKESELGWIPREWELESLNNIVINHHSGIYKNSALYGEGFNIVGVSDLYYHDSINGQIFRQVPLSQVEKDNFTLNEGDIIYGESSLVLDGIAKALWVTQNGAGTVFAWHTRRMKIDRNKILPQYLYFLLCSAKIRSYIMSVATQTALTGITTRDYFRTPVSIPAKKEQEAIEKKLQAIDTIIQFEKTNYIKYKNLKQGIMSDLLTGKIPVKYEEDKAGVSK